MKAEVNNYDYLKRYPKIAQWVSTALINICGRSRSGFFMKIELEKI
jgi:hypothetical protein